MNAKKNWLLKIWQRAWLIGLLIALISLPGCADTRVIGQIEYSQRFKDKLADEIEQEKCGPFCVSALTDWQALIVRQ